MFPRGNTWARQTWEAAVSPGKHLCEPSLAMNERAHITEDQIDLFLPYLADLDLRDQREMMERPFFSLS